MADEWDDFSTNLIAGPIHAFPPVEVVLGTWTGGVIVGVAASGAKFVAMS